MKGDFKVNQNMASFLKIFRFTKALERPGS